MSTKNKTLLSILAVVLIIIVAVLVYTMSQWIVQKRKMVAMQKAEIKLPPPSNLLLYPFWFSYTLRAKPIAKLDLNRFVEEGSVFVTNFVDFTPTFYSTDLSTLQAFYTFKITKKSGNTYKGWIKVHTVFHDLTKYVREDNLNVMVDPSTGVLNKVYYKDKKTDKSMTANILRPKISSDGNFLEFVLEKDGREKLMQFRKVALLPIVFDPKKLRPSEGSDHITIPTVSKEATQRSIAMLRGQAFVLEGFYSSLVAQEKEKYSEHPIVYMIRFSGEYDKTQNIVPFDFVIAALDEPDNIYQKNPGILHFQNNRIIKITLGLPNDKSIELPVHEFLINPTSNVLSILVVKNIAEIGSTVTPITLKRVK